MNKYQILNIAERRPYFQNIRSEKIKRIEAVIVSIGKRHRKLYGSDSSTYVKMITKAWNFYISAGGSKYCTNEF